VCEQDDGFNEQVHSCFCGRGWQQHGGRCGFVVGLELWVEHEHCGGTGRRQFGWFCGQPHGGGQTPSTGTCCCGFVFETDIGKTRVGLGVWVEHEHFGCTGHEQLGWPGEQTHGGGQTQSTGACCGGGLGFVADIGIK
jgi:hypothetical protein